MDKKLKQQIENGEFETLFLYLESKKLYIDYHWSSDKIVIASKTKEVKWPIEITLDTLIEIIKKKDVFPFIDLSSHREIFKKVFEKYITEDLLKSYIDIFWESNLKGELGTIKELFNIVPDEYRELVKEFSQKYMPPLVKGIDYNGIEHEGYLLGKYKSFVKDNFTAYSIVPQESFDENGILHTPDTHPDSEIKPNTIVLADNQDNRNFVYLSHVGSGQYVDAEGNTKDFISFKYKMLSLNDILSLDYILQQNFKKNPKEIILKVIEELNGKISLSNNRCALLSKNETCIGIFDYDLLLELIKENRKVSAKLNNIPKEIMKKIIEMLNEDPPKESISLDSYAHAIEYDKKSIISQESPLREVLSHYPKSIWLMLTEKMAEVAPPLVNVKIGEKLCSGYLFSSSIEEKIFFVEEKAIDGSRLDINYIHEFNPNNQIIQYIPFEKNNILCMIDKYEFSPQTGYFNSKNPEKYYYTGYFDSQPQRRYHHVSEDFGYLSILSSEQVKELIEQHNMIVVDGADTELMLPKKDNEDNTELKENPTKFELYDIIQISDGNIYPDMYSMVEGVNSIPSKSDNSAEYFISGIVIVKDKDYKMIDIYTPDYDDLIEAYIENGYKVKGYAVNILNHNTSQSKNDTTVLGFIQKSSASRTIPQRKTR